MDSLLNVRLFLFTFGVVFNVIFLDEFMKRRYKQFIEELRKNGATRYDVTMSKDKRKTLHRNVVTWAIHLYKVRKKRETN
jgi:hypothetical protein